MIFILKLCLFLLLMLPALVMLLTGCAANSGGSSLPPGVQQAQIPPLPLAARQPALDQMPSICSQGCSQGLTQLRESWRARLIEAAPPASSAPRPMTP